MLDLAGLIWISSAFVVSASGLALLGVRKRLPVSAFLAVFLVGWGAQLLFSGLAGDAFLEGRDATLFVELSIATLMLLYIPLLLFGQRYRVRHGRPARDPRWDVLLPLPGLAGLAALVLAPASVVQVGATAAAWGPVALVHFGLFLGALLFMLVSLHRHQMEATARIEVRRTVNALLGMLVFVSFLGAENAVYHGRRFVQQGSLAWPEVGDAVMALFGLGTLAVVSTIGADVVLHPRLGARKPSAYAVPAILAPAGLGAALGLSDLPATFVTPLDGIGVWRAFSAILVVWAILHYEQWNLGQRAKRAGVAAALMAAPLLPILLAYETVGGLVEWDPWLLLVIPLVAAAGGAVFLARSQLVNAFANRLPGSKPEQLDDRRLEVYEATLARLQEESRVESETDFLAQLRASLGISEREHQLLLRLVTHPGAADGERMSLRSGTTVAGRYLLEELLGEGTQGSAYLARDERLGRPVVVKVLSSYQDMTQKAVHRFLREARIAAEHNHPNVVRIYDFGYYGVRPYLVMEYAEGGTLADLLGTGQPVPPQRCVAILDDVLTGLEHIHGHRVLHRDLKPANILFTAEGTAMISDFGLAQHLDGESVRGGLDTFETPCGTPAYMSPEAAKGARLLPQSDVYSVGALLYQLLAGRTYLPFEGKSPADLRWLILHEEAAPLPEAADPALAAVALRALRKDPEQRYASAEAMRQALHGGTGSQPAPGLRVAQA